MIPDDYLLAAREIFAAELEKLGLKIQANIVRKKPLHCIGKTARAAIIAIEKVLNNER